MIKRITISLLFCLILFFSIFYWETTQIVENNLNSLMEKNETEILDKALDLYANGFLQIQNDPFIINVSAKCNNSEFSYYKIRCVNNEIKKVYGNYTPQDSLNPVKYTLENGGDCKNWAMIYRAIFTKMNLNNSYIWLPKHVYNNVNTKFIECIVDQKSLLCKLK